MSELRWYYNRLKSYLGRPRLEIQEKMVVVNDDDFCASPLFEIGAHRSGTSLLRRMLNSHPDICCPPESFFIEYYAKMFATGAVRSGYEGLGYDLDHCRLDLMRKASNLHEAFRIGQGKSLWADKTPEYTRCVEEIDALYGHQARFLLIYRHPWDIVHSIWKRGWRLNETGDVFESALAYTRDTIAHMRAFEKAQPERTSRILYSDLCADAEATLTPAMAKLGLSYHPEMLNFGSNNHNWGMEDPVIRGKKTIEISERAWTSWSKAERARAKEVLDPDNYADLF